MYAESGPLGGPGNVIECDEMKLGRRKYQRGRVVESNWILGMVDIETNEVRLEICPDNKRDANTLLKLIQKHVQPNTTLFTDLWKGYNNLNENGFQHMCVNHSLQFVTDEGVNTNKIKSQWRPVRQRLARGGVQKEKLADHLCEFLWRRDVGRRDVDYFDDILNHIRNQFPGH